MPKLDFISYTLIILSPLFLLSMSVFSIVFDQSHYSPLFEKFGVYGTVRNADELNIHVLDYLAGNEGTLPEAFNEREKGHMEDVKDVFGFLKRVLVAFPLLVVAAAFKWGKTKKIMVAKSIMAGSLISLILFALLLPFIAFAFSSSFNAFHGIFFEEGSYLFDPATDVLVQLYPEELFFAFAQKIALFAVLLSAYCCFASFLMKKDLKH
jgi:integral membrane protein (TIGR01906 family)